MTDTVLHVLFLCNHNTGRSLMAQALLNHIGKGRFKAWSAGCCPRDEQPNPLALQVLQNAGISTDGLHSKAWDEFGAVDAPHMDLIITLCDSVNNEVCPVWPGHAATAHWGLADPAALDADDAHKREAFRHTLHALHQRLELLINLAPEKLAHTLLQDSARRLHQV